MFNSNEIIEACAIALEKERGFNPNRVKLSMQLFGMNAFSNTPNVTGDDWHYLRDAGTHSALIYNSQTEELIFINIPKFKTNSQNTYAKLINSKSKTS